MRIEAFYTTWSEGGEAMIHCEVDTETLVIHHDEDDACMEGLPLRQYVTLGREEYDVIWVSDSEKRIKNGELFRQHVNWLEKQTSLDFA